MLAASFAKDYAKHLLPFPTYRIPALVTVSVPATGLVTRNDRKTTKVGQRHRCEELKKVGSVSTAQRLHSVLVSKHQTFPKS